MCNSVLHIRACGSALGVSRRSAGVLRSSLRATLLPSGRRPRDTASAPRPLQKPAARNPHPHRILDSVCGEATRAMKFGKRLSAEAVRSSAWAPFYFDYKAAKRSIAEDIQRSDSSGWEFDSTMARELSKISTFYAETEQELVASFLSRGGEWEAKQLKDYIGSLHELKKYATLNYIAVFKAVKKRNRRLCEALGNDSVSPEDANKLLKQQTFFTSNKLASLSTRAEVLLAQLSTPPADLTAALEEYSCPICLGVLHNPVVFTCAHRFCWGCIVTHYATTTAPSEGLEEDNAAKTSSMATDVSASTSSPTMPSASSEQRLPDRLLRYATTEFEVKRPYDCPCCRRTQFIDLNDLKVDQHLSRFVAGLQSQGDDATQLNNSSVSSTTELMTAPATKLVLRAEAQPFVPAAPAQPGGLLPPLDSSAANKITVVLDMDGTLLSSYSARRSPRLPVGLDTFVTGKGGKLNPGGVLVVERPGLRRFLQELSEFAEVVLFTAGVPEYAEPIIQHLDPDGSIFKSRLYRQATVKSEHYPCVKDLSLLGRDLRKIVLVDDTPLAFLHQPNNGIPVFAFRSDPDDRFLNEAVLPFLQTLAAVADVRPIVAKRFGMVRWFAHNGFKAIASPEQDDDEGSVDTSVRLPSTAAISSKAGSEHQKADSSTARRRAHSKTLLLMDFDKTVTVADAGESLIGEIAPELLPMLDGIEMPASFIDVYNDILAEMQRRGIARDALLAALRDLGDRLIPDESRRALKMAARRGVDTRILSDCNTLFISHMLTGANVRQLVREIITNGAAFERMASSASSDGDEDGAAWRYSQQTKAAQHRVVVSPRHRGHSCPMCPSNLCKGAELLDLRRELGYDRIIYCGDGANDICPSLKLGENDVVCTRKGHSLEYLIRDRMSEMKAKVVYWEDHKELLSALSRVMS